MIIKVHYHVVEGNDLYVEFGSLADIGKWLEELTAQVGRVTITMVEDDWPHDPDKVK